MIHLEAPTHRDDEAGALLNSSGATYVEARAEFYDQVPSGSRLTWIRRVNATELRG